MATFYPFCRIVVPMSVSVGYAADIREANSTIATRTAFAVRALLCRKFSSLPCFWFSVFVQVSMHIDPALYSLIRAALDITYVFLYAVDHQELRPLIIFPVLGTVLHVVRRLAAFWPGHTRR
jgi:hypothetical protein